MTQWQITFDVYPHSTGKGATIDRELAGDATPIFVVEAQDMCAAFRFAKAIGMGLRANPAVWETPITCIRKITR